MLRTLAVRFSIVSFAWTSAVQAEATTEAAAAEVPPEPEVSTTDATGWYVLAASLLVGAALTTYGLGIDCDEHDHACHRRASLPIWGGVGVAASGSILGLYLVQPPGGASNATLTLGATFN